MKVTRREDPIVPQNRAQQGMQDHSNCGLGCGLKIAMCGPGIGYRRLARIRKIRLDC